MKGQFSRDEMKIWFGDGVILFSLVLSEALLAPTLANSLNADDMWHFKWASDILAGNPIFWFGVDANRIFPDLLFSLSAAVLPGGQSYDIWLIYFFCISGFSLGLSLILLSRALYTESSERLLFFAWSCATFVAVTTTLSFWSFHLMAPGNHGGSLSMVITVTALFLMNVKAERINYLFLFAFALICVLLVMSNRYLVVCLMAPVLMAALLAAPDRGRQAVLVLATLLATAAGLEALHLLNSSDFYRLVNPGRRPPLHDFLTLIWWQGRIPKELRELADVWRRDQIILGLATMAAAMIWGFWLPLRKSEDKNSTLGLPRIFRLIVAISTLCTVLFIIVMVDDDGDWRYRFFTVPFCLSLIALSAVPVYPFSFKRRAWLVAVCLPALSLMMAAAWFSLDIRGRTYKAQFQSDLRQLSHILTDHDGMTVHNGIANYQIANEVSVYSADINVLTGLTSENEPGYWLYNDNASELCDKRDFSFILVQEGRDSDYQRAEAIKRRAAGETLAQIAPNMDPIVTEIGPPSYSQRIQLGHFGSVQVLFYDAELLDKKIIQPARAAARSEFPNFQCFNTARSEASRQ
jgi:hypothetical protein